MENVSQAHDLSCARIFYCGSCQSSTPFQQQARYLQRRLTVERGKRNKQAGKLCKEIIISGRSKFKLDLQKIPFQRIFLIITSFCTIIFSISLHILFYLTFSKRLFFLLSFLRSMFYSLQMEQGISHLYVIAIKAI